MIIKSLKYMKMASRCPVGAFYTFGGLVLRGISRKFGIISSITAHMGVNYRALIREARRRGIRKSNRGFKRTWGFKRTFLWLQKDVPL